MTDTTSSPSARRHFLRARVLKLLAQVTISEITIREGSRTWRVGQPGPLDCEVTVHNRRLYRAIAVGGSIGAAESYAAGDWDCTDLAHLLRILVIHRALLDRMDGGLSKWLQRLWNLGSRRNTQAGARHHIAAHYDLSNALFEAFLDESMMYSSGWYRSDDDTLAQAQQHKLQRICEQLQLRADDHLIEIGTGWAGMALYAAQNYGCRVTTTTISQQQYRYAQQRVAEAGLNDRITVLDQDYRALNVRGNKLVSIEMIEAVGARYLDTYSRTLDRLLTEDGVALLQAITIEDFRYQQALTTPDLIKRHIFPGSFIPSLAVIANSLTTTGSLVIDDVKNIAPSYAKTLHAWRQRFDAAEERIAELGFDRWFHRMWRFYFAYCEAGFAEGALGDLQITLTKPAARSQTRRLH